MKKVVINKCYGGFGLSEKATMRYAELKGIKLYSENVGGFTRYYLCEPEKFHKLVEEARKTGIHRKSNEMYFDEDDIKRDDPILIQVVEEFGEEANGNYAELKIFEIPSDLDYEITNYDGVESIRGRHIVWA